MPPKSYYAVFVHEYVSTQLLKLILIEPTILLRLSQHQDGSSGDFR